MDVQAYRRRCPIRRLHGCLLPECKNYRTMYRPAGDSLSCDYGSSASEAVYLKVSPEGEGFTPSHCGTVSQVNSHKSLPSRSLTNLPFELALAVIVADAREDFSPRYSESHLR
jgi:hypothetical protein